MGNLVGYPDYSKNAMTSITTRGTSYQMVDDGWVLGNIKASGGGAAQLLVGQRIIMMARSDDDITVYVFIPMKKGVTFQTRAEYGDYDLTVLYALK